MFGCPSARVILHPKYGVVVAIRLEDGDLNIEEMLKAVVPEDHRFWDPRRGVWYISGALWMELGEIFFSLNSDITWPDPFLVPEFPDAQPPSAFSKKDRPIGADEPFDARRKKGEPPRPFEDDDYGLMGLSPSADTDVVKAAYRVLCMKWHPDKGGSHEKMTALNEAFSKIMAHRAKKKEG